MHTHVWEKEAENRFYTDLTAICKIFVAFSLLIDCNLIIIFFACTFKKF